MLQKILNTYFDKNLEFQVQVYNLLAFTGIISGFAVAVVAVFLRDSIYTVIIDFSVAALSYMLLRITEKKKCYRLCSRIFVGAVFFIMFPALFFSCGGVKSGAAYSFMIAFSFTAILLEKYERVAAIALEFILYSICCLVVFYKPDTAYILPTDLDYFIVHLLNFSTAGVVLVTVLLIRNRIFDARREWIEELNREFAVRNETLARYDNMKNDFLATVAHEINTPLAIISASSSDTLDLLKETPLNIGEITENQQLIVRRVKLIDNIVLDLMDTVAIENGRISLNRQPVSLMEQLAVICDNESKKLDANNNAITYDLESDLPLIWLDPLRIEQVVTNLIANALRHTREGTVTVKLIRQNDKQIVSVTDNGEGMDAEMARIALRRYVSTKADYWRHGIGLYICRQIVTAHGGEIWIESEKGLGTTVSFALKEDPEYE